MKNEKRTKRKEKQPTSTIVLDKLIFSCVSTVEDNFNYVAAHEPDYYNSDFQFGLTKLVRTQDPSRRYRYSYKVYYSRWLIGSIDFAPYFGLGYDMLRFSVDNEAFYNDTLKYLPTALDDLNLEINNFTQIDIAVDSYKFNTEQIVRRNLKNKENTVKLIGNIVYDRNKTINVLYYYHKGSLNNPYKIRTILIKKQKKNTTEVMFYDKTEEIKEVSKKYYILEFHKQYNPKLRKIYRAEVRFGYEGISRYVEKRKRPISIEDLLNQEFLYEMFSSNLDSLLTIYEGTGRKKAKIQLVDIPKIEPSEGILQPTLPVSYSNPLYSRNEYFDLDKFINNYYDKLYKNELFINNITNNNRSKYL